MEQSGRNQRQPVANGNAPETASTSQNRCHRLRPVADRAHGKEGVDGSSPSEGFAELSADQTLGCPHSKRLSRAGTCGHGLMFARRSHARACVGLDSRVGPP
jgi:hypothetical protein